MLESNPHSAHVAARLLDFFDSVIPWHRRLWSVGINLSLKEVAETSDAVAEGVISDAAFATLRKTTLDVAHRDPGVDRRHLNGLKQCLMSDVRAGSGPYYALAHMAEVVEQSYLPLWASALGDNTPPEPESAARCIASSLLDLGFSSQYLHKWWSYRIKHEDGIRSIGDLVLEAHEDLVRRSPRAITVFVPFTAVPGTPWSDPVWLDPHSAASWLAVHGFSTGERLGGALLLELTELDAWAAVMRAAEHVDRLNARVALGTDKQLVPVGKAWVPECRKPFPLQRRRRVRVGALQRQAKVLSLSEASPVDSSLALLAPLQEQTPTSAVTSSWAALEGLLIGPREGSHSQAAHRLGALAACSWPRAELTALAHAHRSGASDELAVSLKQAATNRERSRLVAEALQNGQRLQLSKPSDAAAQARMLDLLAAPRATMERVQEYITRTMLRLYRQRNLVMHGGKTESESITLQAALRTAAPLVGAGFDRIVHAWLEHGVEPLDLAAKAQTRLWCLESSMSTHLTDLLE